jgi:hypothetical protein
MKERKNEGMDVNQKPLSKKQKETLGKFEKEFRQLTAKYFKRNKRQKTNENTLQMGAQLAVGFQEKEGGFKIVPTEFVYSTKKFMEVGNMLALMRSLDRALEDVPKQRAMEIKINLLKTIKAEMQKQPVEGGLVGSAKQELRPEIR